MEKILCIYKERSDGDYEFVAAIDRDMFGDEFAALAIADVIESRLQEEGETFTRHSFGATDQIVDILELKGETTNETN